MLADLRIVWCDCTRRGNAVDRLSVCREAGRWTIPTILHLSLWLICLTGQHVLTAGIEGEERTYVLQWHTQWPLPISTSTITAITTTTINITIGLKWLVMFESSPHVFKADYARELLPGRAARTDKTTPARNEWEWSPAIPHIEASLEHQTFLSSLFQKKM